MTGGAGLNATIQWQPLYSVCGLSAVEAPWLPLDSGCGINQLCHAALAQLEAGASAVAFLLFPPLTCLHFPVMHHKRLNLA